MSKGDRRERQFVQILKNAGFATYRPATVAFGENDIFGLFDVLAFSPDYRYNVGVQVKSNRATGIRTWERNTQVFRELEWITLYAVPVDREGWRLLECTSEGTFTLVDERSRDCSMGEGLEKWFNEAQE